MIFKRRL